MMKKVMLILSCLFLSVGLIYSQTITVNGIVVDDAGIEVVGASVVVKGTTTGVATDVDGKFSLNVPSNSTLVFSLVGMKKVEMKATPSMNVVMENDDALLEEVVVTGYGSVKKASFTGSASVLSTDKLENVPSVSLEAKLAGAAAGVKLGSSAGQPGSVESIRIRGAGSVMASNEPLYVIDGVPVLSGNSSEFSYSESGNSILSTINTNDIENITIIKDAGAAALYGSRAANGVIVITTKSGKAGKTTVNLRANWGFSDMAINYRPTLKGDARRELLHLGLVNYAKDNNNADPTAFADRNIDTFAEKPWSGWTDWKDVLFRTGSQSNYEATIQGGNDKMSVFSSLAYNKMDGITKGSDYNRVTGRLNASYKGIENLVVNFNGTFSNSKQSSYGEGTGYSSPIMAISMTTSPQDYPYNEDGTINVTNKFESFPRPVANPLQSMTLNSEKNEMDRFLGSVNARYDIYNGLYAYQNISYDYLGTVSKVWWHPKSNDGLTANGNFQRYNVRNDKLISQTRLGYNKTFGKHSIDGLLAYEVEKYKSDYLYGGGQDYPNPNKPEIGAATTKRSSSGYEENRMISYLAFANYNFDNRYYLGASLRRDGSSKFRRSDRWGDFWSVSGSWRLSDESFAQQMKDVVNDAKVRVSYGVNGNLPLSNYAFLDSYAYGYMYNGQQGSAPSRLAYEALTWEENKSLNIGLDFSLFNRIDFVVDWYTRDSDNLLLPFQISQTAGFGTITMNKGKINNQGIEVSVTSRNIISKDFNWSTSFNIAHNRNELKNIDGESLEMAGLDGRLRHVVGKPYSQFYLYEYAGVDPDTGKESFYKNKGNNPRETTTNVGEASRIIADKVDPLVQGGITNNFSYKDFDLGFTFTYSLGGHLYDGASGWIGTDGGSLHYTGNIPSYYKVEDMWQKQGDNAKLPRYVYNNTTATSTRWVRSSDHLRLKNVTFGYSLPKQFAKKAGLGKVRFYASAVNLFTIKSKDLAVDPEVPVDLADGVRSYGVVFFQTPPLRTVTFGVDVTF